MQVTIFGATGGVGSECVSQCLEAGHDVKVLVRTPSKLAPDLASRLEVVQGDGLVAGDVSKALEGAEVVFFAIGIDSKSPEDLCTDSTRLILAGMREHGVRRLVWCGGGSTIVEEDQVTFGARFVEVFTTIFMGLRHRDKTHQYELLQANRDVEWVGVRPLQIRKGARTGVYRVGFDTFSGMSKISFADVAHAMITMIDDDRWLHKAPIVQY